MTDEARTADDGYPKVCIPIADVMELLDRIDAYEAMYVEEWGTGHEVPLEESWPLYQGLRVMFPKEPPS